MSNKELEILDTILKAAEVIRKREVMDDHDAGYRLAFIHILDELKEESTKLKTISEELD